MRCISVSPLQSFKQFCRRKRLICGESLGQPENGMATLKKARKRAEI